MAEKIDFVITWLDDSDPKWRKEFESCAAKEKRIITNNPCRFRDWGTLKYWFRGVEKYAPWVNKIYFVTYGHLPKWLDTTNPKLVVVKHEDYIPAEYLPTFNSYCIEYFFHRIKGLSEKFVYFNDDMFLIDSVSPERFFRDGLPCDIGWLRVYYTKPSMFGQSVHLALDLIRANFNKKEAISKNRSKWFSFSRLTTSKNNLKYYWLPAFSGFENHHLPQGYLKNIYEEVWLHGKEDLHRTCSNKFRTYGDVCHWIIRYWQLASGKFTPYDVFKDGLAYNITEDNINAIKDCIEHQKLKMVCLNDNEDTHQFEEKKQIILNAFNKILPDKCSFEL